MPPDSLRKNKEYDLNDIEKALDNISIKSNVVFVHSSVLHLGVLRNVDFSEYPGKIVNKILEYLGSDSTLIVPAPNWDYGSKEIPFDIAKTPVSKELGVISKYVVEREGSFRSPNPIFSVTAIGTKAEYICHCDTGTAFGYDSPWDKMFRLNADMLFLGCDLTYLPFARYIEQRMGVPYLYNKLFDVPVLNDDNSIDLDITAPLRFHEYPAYYELARFEKYLRNKNILRETTLGAGQVMGLDMNSCFKSGVNQLKKDIHYFLKGRPEYVKGCIPFG